jgi:ABC-type uncharacterized transport system ATPase subunit
MSATIEMIIASITLAVLSGAISPEQGAVLIVNHQPERIT